MAKVTQNTVTELLATPVAHCSGEDLAKYHFLVVILLIYLTLF